MSLGRFTRYIVAGISGLILLAIAVLLIQQAPLKAELNLYITKLPAVPTLCHILLGAACWPICTRLVRVLVRNMKSLRQSGAAARLKDLEKRVDAREKSARADKTADNGAEQDGQGEEKA